MNASNRTALTIYVVMARDWGDALEMIQGCDDRAALTLLLGMITSPGTNSTDAELQLFVGPVQRRLETL